MNYYFNSTIIDTTVSMTKLISFICKSPGGFISEWDKTVQVLNSVVRRKISYHMDLTNGNA